MRPGPDTLAELVRILGVEDRDEDEQFAAVAQWWGHNEVHRPLWRDVAARGGRWFTMADNGRSLMANTYPELLELTPEEATASRRRCEQILGGVTIPVSPYERGLYRDAGLKPPTH